MLTKAPFISRICALAVATFAMVVISVGCAITDYRGQLGHMTESEARLWGSEVAFSGTGSEALDGTYSYTVKYDFRGTNTVPMGTYPDEITIHTYRNPVVGAFSRDGCSDRDGDEIQGRPGDIAGGCDVNVPAGKFEAKWRYGDSNAGCQFQANYEQTFGSPKVLPVVLLCNNAPVEEVDKDLTLQGSIASNTKQGFSSLQDLFDKIWSGALEGTFAANVTSVSFNGVNVVLEAPVALSINRNDIRPLNAVVDISSPGAQSLLKAILANSADETAVRLSFGFEGGMRINAPSVLNIAFNHDEVAKLIN
jgi:hypothetical protein